MPPGEHAFWTVGLELDAPRQARRLVRLVRRESEGKLLRRAVGGRRVLITGASAGIGRETARRVGAAGAEVLLVARRRERLEDVAAEIAATGATAHVLPCDLSDPEGVDALAQHVLDEHDGVDVLVNNAGKSIRRTVWEQAARHDFERIMRVNYFGVLRLTMPLAERMRERRRGHVINVLTMGTQVGPVPRFSGYAGSKAALDVFTRCAAGETARDGIRWTSVHMPLVRTEMIAPTKAYDDAPAMTVGQAGDMLVDAIVRRPARVTHPYGTVLQLIDLAAPRFVEARWADAIGAARRRS